MNISETNDTSKATKNPLLVHVGYHKTASTWLQNLVFQPENGFIQPCTMRELYSHIVLPDSFLFDYRDARRFIEERIDSLKNKNHVCVLSHERLCGDPFTGSRDAKEIASRLHSTFPSAKILIVIREQFELITSLYKTYVLHGGKASLEEFLNPKVDEVNQWFDYKTYCFVNLIEYYNKLFGKDNVIVIAYEELKKNNQGFYEKLCDVMGTERRTLETKVHRKVNFSLCDLGTEVLRRINFIFGIFYTYPLGISSNRLWRVFRTAVFKMEWLFKRVSSRGKLKDRTKKLLAGKFKEDNTLLQSHINIDLHMAGYEL